MIFLLILHISLCLGIPGADPGADPEASILSANYGAGLFCSNGGYCVPPVACAPNYFKLLSDPGAACYLAPGTPGVCCQPRQPTCK